MRLRRTPLLLDLGLAVMLTGLTIATIATRPSGWVGWPEALLAVLSIAPVALRQVAPVLTLIVIVAALGGYALSGFVESPSSGIGILIAMFTVATLRSRRVAAAAYAATVAVLLLTYVTGVGITWTMFAQASLVALCAWALGEGTRGWAREVQETAAAVERSVADERTRIARELHDVVAHHMSVVALQTGVAGYVLDSDPVAARTAVDHAASAGREALHDMGRMLDALRTVEESQGAPYLPQPGLRDLGGLVDRLRGAGLQVEVTRVGRPQPLSPGADLCAFRIVQESLTNVLKHAGPGAAARVVVEHADRLLEVSVLDDGAPTRPPARSPRGVPGGVQGGGHGIRGMRERAELYGGVLEAAPRAGGGFGVHLRLPLASPVGQAREMALDSAARVGDR